jgi:DNA polymerase-3 subunit alpha
MYAAVGFYQAARKARVKPIVGVQIDIEWRVTSGEWREKRKQEVQSVPVVLLAADMEGYSNLCQLVTLRHLGTTELAQSTGSDEEDGRPVTLEELERHSRGVIALAPVRQKERFLTRDGGLGMTEIKKLKEIFGERLYIEVQHLSPGDGRALREAERIGRELGVPLVATNNVHFLRPEEHLHHRAVNAIRTGGLLTTVLPKLRAARRGSNRRPRCSGCFRTIRKFCKRR